MNEKLSYDPERRVTNEDLATGLVVWSATMNVPMTVTTLTPSMAILRTPSGSPLHLQRATFEQMLFFHMVKQQDTSEMELRSLAYNLIEQGQKMLQLLDQMSRNKE